MDISDCPLSPSTQISKVDESGWLARIEIRLVNTKVASHGSGYFRDSLPLLTDCVIFSGRALPDTAFRFNNPVNLAAFGLLHYYPIRAVKARGWRIRSIKPPWASGTRLSSAAANGTGQTSAVKRGRIKGESRVSLHHSQASENAQILAYFSNSPPTRKKCVTT